MQTGTADDRRRGMRWACRAFSTREEENIWLEMCSVPTVSYLRLHELEMLFDIVMKKNASGAK